MKINSFWQVLDTLAPGYRGAPAINGWPKLFGEEFDICRYSTMCLPTNPLLKENPNGYYVWFITDWARISFDAMPDHGELKKECFINPKVLKKSTEEQIADYKKRLTEIECAVIVAICG